MNETPFFFGDSGEPIFGVLHRTGLHAKNIGWVLCHGFAEEKLWSHRVFVNFARDLALKGYNVLRFDYRGYGDSGGLFENSTIKSQLSDVGKAVETLRLSCPEVERVGLVGLRYGATIACLAAEQLDICDRLIMWAPVTDMERYLQEALRANLTTQMVMYGEIRTNRKELVEEIMDGSVINVDGYDLSKELYKSACEIDVLGAEKSYAGPCQVVQIGRANQAPKKDLMKLCSLYPDAKFVQVVEEQFWKEIKNLVQRSESLTRAACEWLESLDE